MAEATAAPAAKVPEPIRAPSAASVKRSVDAGKDPKNPQTKDGKKHEFGAIVVHCAAASDRATLLAAIDELILVASAIETGRSIVVKTNSGKDAVVPVVTEFADGKNKLVRGKDIFPLSYASVTDMINEAIDGRANTKLTAFRNTFRPGYGGSRGGGEGLEDDFEKI